jgi:hypothetical protein
MVCNAVRARLSSTPKIIKFKLLIISRKVGTVIGNQLVKAIYYSP